MTRRERFEKDEIEQALDNAYDSEFAKNTGRIAVETPPIYFSSPKRAVPEHNPDQLSWDDMGTYLERE